MWNLGIDIGCKGKGQGGFASAGRAVQNQVRGVHDAACDETLQKCFECFLTCDIG